MTPTTATPEELAKDIWHDVSRDAFIDARMSSREEAAWKEEACDAIAAAIRQHSAPLEAQIAELQSMLKASSTGEFRATERAEAAEARATQAEAALAAVTKERDDLHDAIVEFLDLEPSDGRRIPAAKLHDELMQHAEDEGAEVERLEDDLSAALERERVMREALERADVLMAVIRHIASRQEDCRLGWSVALSPAEARAIVAAIQPKEQAHDR